MKAKLHDSLWLIIALILMRNKFPVKFTELAWRSHRNIVMTDSSEFSYSTLQPRYNAHNVLVFV